MPAPTALQFSALGTEWSILLDTVLSQHDQALLRRKVLAATDEFDQRCSRFIPTSEACSFRHAKPGEYHVSEQFSQLLSAAQDLNRSTGGEFDPAVGTLLELAGYDNQYRFAPRPTQIEQLELPAWRITGKTLHLSGGVVFDIGGIGKGYWIDQVADLLRSDGYQHFLVDGGGDMYATTKAGGRAWQIALEWPNDPERALGTVALSNQGIAISDVFKRRWGTWHHIISPQAKSSTNAIIWSASVGSTAFLADQATSALMLMPVKHGKPAGIQVAERLGCASLVLQEDGALLASRNWAGQLFD